MDNIGYRMMVGPHCPVIGHSYIARGGEGRGEGEDCT